MDSTDFNKIFNNTTIRKQIPSGCTEAWLMDKAEFESAAEAICSHEQTRWQQAITELLIKLTGCTREEIDQDGNDSGDPLDWTLGEIKAAINCYNTKKNTNVKEMVYFALDEITAIDEEFRQEPNSIHNPIKRRKAINRAFITTCNKFGIIFTEEDVRIEGDKQLIAIFNLIKSKDLKEGEPCGHPGCLNHTTHPCEGCGRIAGKNNNITSLVIKPRNCGSNQEFIEKRLKLADDLEQLAYDYATGKDDGSKLIEYVQQKLNAI